MLRSTTREQARQRRRSLKAAVGSGLVYLPGAKEPIRNYQSHIADFRQSSHVLYFTGLPIPECGIFLDLDNDSLHIFTDEMGPDELVWHDREPNHEELADITGADSVHSKSELEKFFTEAILAHRSIHVLKSDDWPGLSPSTSLIKAIIDLRVCKSADEISQMEAAMHITAKAHHMAMAVTKAGLYEHEIQAIVESVFRVAGASPSYAPIATCRGEVLHACKPHRKLEDGQLFLLDAGAELNNSYATDITRTWPVNGRYSDEQAALYDIVLRAQKAAIASCQIGSIYGAVHKSAAMEIIDGLTDFGLLKGNSDDIYNKDAHALFFPHGVGHLIGLDVHDLEDLGEDQVGYADGYQRDADKLGRRYLRLNRKLDDGFVVTVEPGIYFIPAYLEDKAMEERFGAFVDFEKARSLLSFGGVRIEDDVAISAAGPKVIGPGIPKERAEIESIVGSKSDLIAALRV